MTKPALTTRFFYARGGRSTDPGFTPGELIAVAGKPWRVLDVEDVPNGDWSDRARAAWVTGGCPDPWALSPYRVILSRPDDADPTPHMWLIEPWDRVRVAVLPEHYAVCHKCGDLAPCLVHRQHVEAATAAARAVEAMAVPEGHCPSCAGPVTSRMKTINFPGPNLLNPLAGDWVRFHDRRSCRYDAKVYAKLWDAANTRQAPTADRPAPGGPA